MSQSQTHPIFLVINPYTLQVQSVQTYLGVRNVRKLSTPGIGRQTYLGVRNIRKLSTPGIGRQNNTQSAGFDAPQCRSAK